MSDVDEAVQTYLREVANVQPLTRDEESALFQQVQETNDDNAKRRLIESKLSVVVEVARSYVGAAGMNLLDLIQEGNCGLLRAVDTFVNSGSDNFGQHVKTQVEKGILRTIEELQRHS